MIDKADRIYVDTWQEICQEINHPRLIHATTDSAHELLTVGPKEPSIVVLSYSDFGIEEQELDHPNANLYDMAMSIPFNSIARERKQYCQFNVGPACNPEKCNVDDKYSMKVNRFTEFTFSKLPENVVKLYTVNLNVNSLPRTELIPFGLNRENGVTAPLDDYINNKKSGLLYCNWQNYTLDRVMLKHHFSSQDWVTFRPEPNLPVATYLDELASHKFALCPAGNGHDQYRVSECLLLYTLPILTKTVFSQKLMELGLPILTCNNMTQIISQSLENVNFFVDWDNLHALKKSYWKKKIEDELKQNGL